jgi:hypothetical protein
MPLHRELDTYRRERPAWVARGLAGRWVVILGDDVAGFHPTLEDALADGYERFGVSAVFLVRQIADTEGASATRPFPKQDNREQRRPA